MAEALTLETPDGAVLLRTASSVMAVVEAIEITDDETLVVANDELGAVKRKIKDLEERQKQILSPLAEVEKRIRDLFRQPLLVLREADGKVKLRIGNYMDEQERRRREAQRQAEEAARRERERLEQEAARVRAEAEAQARKLAEEAQAAAQAGDAAKAAELAVQAQQTADQGVIESAQAAVAAAVVSAPVVAATTKVAGTTIRRIWKGRCVDKPRLVAFIAANPGYLSLLDVNDSQVNALAKAMEDRLGTAVPGLEAYQETQVANRA